MNETEISNYINFKSVEERNAQLESLKFYLKQNKIKFHVLGFGWNREFKHFFQIETEMKGGLK